MANAPIFLGKVRLKSLLNNLIFSVTLHENYKIIILKEIKKMNEKRFETIEAFAEAVRIEIEQRLQKKATIQKVNKNNGLTLHGLTVLEDKVNISPTIYIESFYEAYEEVGMESIIDTIEEIYEENKINYNFDINSILDYESIKENLRAKLINYELNREFLKEVPHRRFLDLAIIVYIEINDKVIADMASVIVKNNILESWDISKEEMISIAIENSEKNINIMNMSDIVDLTFYKEEVNMYVATNHEMLNGAIAMVNIKKIKELADTLVAQELIIIPSSIHEIILVTLDDMMDDKTYIHDMIKSVNSSIVNKSDVLSENYYIYNKEDNEIRIA